MDPQVKNTESMMMNNKMTCEAIIGVLSSQKQSHSKAVNPSYPNPRRREKIKLNFYFHTSL